MENILSVQDLPDDVRSVVEHFAMFIKMLMRIDHPVGAYGNCHNASTLFRDGAEALGVQGVSMVFIDTHAFEELYGPKNEFGQYGRHYVVQYDSQDGKTYLIDFTARQFREELPFPLVFRHDGREGLFDDEYTFIRAREDATRAREDEHEQAAAA